MEIYKIGMVVGSRYYILSKRRIIHKTKFRASSTQKRTLVLIELYNFLRSYRILLRNGKSNCHHPDTPRLKSSVTL